MQEQQKVIIKIVGLRKVYRVGDEKVLALNNLDLEILRGQFVCITGTSGSGKSTLLNQLAGLEKPTRGAVYIGQTNISELSENQLAAFRQRFLGFIFQSYNLLPTLSALENVALPLLFKGVGRKKRNEVAMQMLTAVGLKSRARHKPTQLSGGQQQRVGIARAFVTRPKIIFADEPTGNLDTKTTLDILNTMVRFVRKYKQTLLLVTHDTELSCYADRVIMLRDGAVISDILQTPAGEPGGAQAQCAGNPQDFPGLPGTPELAIPGDPVNADPFAPPPGGIELCQNSEEDGADEKFVFSTGEGTSKEPQVKAGAEQTV